MRKTVLITGVSGGIGKELADCFAKGGQSIIYPAMINPHLFDKAKQMGQSVYIDKVDETNLVMTQVLYASLQSRLNR